MDSVCVTTFLFGQDYQGYIPFLLYSLKKSYPDYVPIIFLHEGLRYNIKRDLELIEPLGEYFIRERFFTNIKISSPYQGNALRWVLNDNQFKNYDYVYFIDSDILYFKEPVPLHLQHLRHMELLDLPFSNVTRKNVVRNRTLDVLFARRKHFGILNAIKNYLKGTVVENRLSGLHFVETKAYFPRVKLAQQKYLDLLVNNAYLKYFQGFSDEPVLYQICEESGFDLGNLGTYSDDYSLDFHNYSSRDFRPHHGIHLGLFRNYLKTDQARLSKILNSDVYKYYLSCLKSYLKDENFIKLLESADKFIRKQFNLLFLYYSLPFQLAPN